MARLFGTDGVRGIANDSLTPELAYHLGRAAAYIFGQNKEHPPFRHYAGRYPGRRYRFGWW